MTATEREGRFDATSMQCKDVCDAYFSRRPLLLVSESWLLMNLDASPLSGTTGLVIGIALGVQLLFAVIGLVVLARTPRERVQFGRKWPWVLIIVFINTIGTILFLAIGRRPAPVADVSAPTSANVPGTVQRLYEGDQR